MPCSIVPVMTCRLVLSLKKASALKKRADRNVVRDVDHPSTQDDTSRPTEVPLTLIRFPTHTVASSETGAKSRGDKSIRSEA